jgi:hypothetical protein
MDDLKNWSQITINGSILWTRYRKDGTKKVTVAFCSLHQMWVVQTFLLPTCKCCAAVAAIHHLNTRAAAKRMATAWLQY